MDIATIEALLAQIQSYNPKADLARIRRAYELAASAHAAQMRSTGDVSISAGAAIQREINQLLLQRYDIAHTALQLECEGCNPDALYCELGDTSS